MAYGIRTPDALSSYIAKLRSRAVGGELVDLAIKIDLNITVLGRGVETMGGQIKGEIIGIHAGIIEGRNQGHEIREIIA